MSQSILEMAKDLIMAQIQAGHVRPDDMQHTLRRIYDSLAVLKKKEEETGTVEGGEENGRAAAPVDWKKSITRHTVTCLACGAAFKQLSNRHLEAHGLDRRSYRVRYGMPRTQPLAAREATAQRRQIVQKTRPWEKAPRSRAAQEREAAQQKAVATPPAKKSSTRRATRRQVDATGKG
jgi:predicted transcriptional regulator